MRDGKLGRGTALRKSPDFLALREMLAAFRFIRKAGFERLRFDDRAGEAA